MLNAGVGASRATGQLPAAAELGGARQHDKHVGVDAGRYGRKGF